MSERRLVFRCRLIAVDDRLDRLRRQRGLSEHEVAKAIATDLGPEDDDDLFRLARYVELLGGQLEIRAVFPDQTVTLLEAVSADR